MENIKWKKIKLSPHTRDKVGLFARDYDRDLYLENDVWSPYAFETKAYPENESKYCYFRFNQDQYAEDVHTARDEAIEELESKEDIRRQAEKKFAEEAAVEKAIQAEAKKPESKAKPKPKATPNKAAAVKKAPVEELEPAPVAKKAAAPKPPKPKKLSIEDRDSLNDLEKLYYEALGEKFDD